MAEWAVPGYTGLRALGSGGFGDVVLARHEATGTPVAVKYLRSELLADPGFVEMFRAEAAVLAGLSDPNIVRLYEYVESPGGAAIVMELVDGVSLRQILAHQGATTAEAALVVLAGSLRGLAAAHRRGVVHRDYKPENVLIGGGGGSKLTDFGIAARAGDRPVPAGTVAYVAPEQAAGGPASPAGDVYAATATFYECLTGAPPFTGDTAQVLDAHRYAPVPLEPVPEPLRPLVAAGMAKDPRWRPADAAGLVTGLQAGAAAAYGPDWAERGRSHLGEAALLLAALWPSGAGPATQATTVQRVPLARHRARVSPAKAVITAGVIAAVAAGGVVIANAVSHGGGARSEPTAAPPLPAAGPGGNIIFQVSGSNPVTCATVHCFWDIHEISPDGTGGHVLPIGNRLCCGSPALSPDGTKLLFTQESAVQVTDLNGHPAPGAWSRSGGPLTTLVGAFQDPVWSPSGKQIAFIFAPGQGQSPEIDVINADGAGRRRVFQSREISIKAKGALAWSPDGTQLAFATTPTVPPGSVTGMASGTIAVISVSGGPPRTVVGNILDGAWGLSWAPGPQILFSNGHQAGIFEADGHGGAKIVMKLVQQCGSCLDAQPSWAPDGVHFAAVRLGKGVIVATVAGGVQATFGPANVSYVQWGGPAGANPPPPAPSPSLSPSLSLSGQTPPPSGAASSPGTVPPGYNTYTNPRFGFTTLWPSSFNPQPPPENGDGLGWVSPDGLVKLSAYGSNNALNMSPQQDESADSRGLSRVYRDITGNIVTVSGYKDGGRVIVYQRDVVGPGSIDTLYWTYPTSQKAQWNAAVTLTAHGFQPGDLATGH